jgi:predicted aldo/keto reductase-like oxidoreductase
MVVYTATRWGDLLNPKRMPAGVPSPRASDCYRVVLSNPSVDVCMTGPKTLDEMREALTTLDRGPMTEEELAWMRTVGDRVRGRKMPWVYGG